MFGCVCICGETCAGKSTLGKSLESIFGGSCISFGDLKRKNIVQGTWAGREIKRLLDSNCPLPAELGWEIIKNEFDGRPNFLIGYPISRDELRVLSSYLRVLGIIRLTINEQTLVERFAVRGECPRCKLSGIAGNVCPTHKVVLLRREDADHKELLFRRRLYLERILPFLNSTEVRSIKQITLDGGLAQHEVLRVTEQWVQKLLS